MGKFPEDLLCKLEDNLLRPRWVVPVLPDQELQTLLRASIDFCKKGIDAENQACQKFMRECLLICFTRLMTDDAIKEWKPEIQKHIFDCTVLFVELCAAKFLEDDVQYMFDILALIFNPRNKYHSHNYQKSVESVSAINVCTTTTEDQNSEMNDEPEIFAKSPLFGPPKGWLVVLINRFGQYGGFKKLEQRFMNEKSLNCAAICTVLKPFGLCYQFLTSETVQTYFSIPLEKSCKYMQNISDEELKKETKGDLRENNPVELVKYLRNLTARVPGRENIVRDLERLRLKMILKTLQLSSFSAKMNALNEISRVLMTSTNFPAAAAVPGSSTASNFCGSTAPSPGGATGSNFNNGGVGSSQNTNQEKSAPLLSSSSVSNFSSAYQQDDALLTTSEIINFMRDNDFLSVAIKENLHILQYVEKLERVLRFFIKEKALTSRDLDLIWMSQSGTKHEAIVKNVHDLLAKVAWDFNSEQLEHLFKCFQRSWRDANKRQREKLLELIRRLAEDDKDGKMAGQVLHLLWNLARDPDSSLDIMEQALQCHAKILDYSCSATNQDRNVLKLQWLEHCVEEIRKDVDLHVSVTTCPTFNNNSSSVHSSSNKNLNNPSSAAAADQSIDDGVGSGRRRQTSGGPQPQQHSWIIPAMKHFREISKQYSEQPSNVNYHQGWSEFLYRNTLLNKLQTEYSLVSLVTSSLVKYTDRVRLYVQHQQQQNSATSSSTVNNVGNNNNNIQPTNLYMDNRYNHLEHVQKRLSFLKFLLRDGQMWLCEAQARQIWDCLIVNPVFPLADRDAGFRWFAKMMDGDGDLDPQIWRRFFESKVLAVEPVLLTESGMLCFERFFKNVNCKDNRLTIDHHNNNNSGFSTNQQQQAGGFANSQSSTSASSSLLSSNQNASSSSSTSLMTRVNNFDMIGQEYLWRVVMMANEVVAERAIELIRDVYGNPSTDMLDKLLQFHADFVQTCTSRLRASYDTLGVLITDKRDNLNQIRQEVTRMQRVLRVLFGYIQIYDDQFHEHERIFLPMYRASMGRTISVTVQFTYPSHLRQVEQSDFITHSNESLGGFRKFILQDLRIGPNSNYFLELYYQNELLDAATEDRKLLGDLDFPNKTVLQGKIIQSRLMNNGGSSPDSSCGESSPEDDQSPQAERVTRSELEELLPSTYISKQPEICQFLLQIADLACKLDSDSLRECSRLVLRILPCCQALVMKLNQSAAAQVANSTFSSYTNNTLQNLFFVSSPNETVYNLELAYCQLVPTRENDLTPNTQINFYRADGVRLCLSMLLQNNFLLQSTDPVIKSTAFYWVLRLLKVLLGVTAYSILATFQTHLKNFSAQQQQQQAAPSAGDSSGSPPTVTAPAPPTPVLTSPQFPLEILVLHSVMQFVGQHDVMRRTLCKGWMERVKDMPPPTQQLPELSHVKRIVKIAWSAASGNFASFSSSNDEIHKDCVQANISKTNLSNDMQDLCREALEVLTLCFALSPQLIEPMTKEKMFQSCIVDLIFSPSCIIRQAAMDQLFLIATKCSKYYQRTLHFFVTLLFTVAYTEAPRNLLICREYFYLLRNLLNHAHVVSVCISNLDVLLEKEINWLKQVREQCLRTLESYPDETLLEGHLMVTKELVNFSEPSKKYVIGSSGDGGLNLIKELLEDFLLPSSRVYIEEQLKAPPTYSQLIGHHAAAITCSPVSSSLIPRSMTLQENFIASCVQQRAAANFIANNTKDVSFSPAASVVSTVLPRSATTIYSPSRCVPVCSSGQTVNAAYDLIVALCSDCVPNMQTTVDLLTEMYYSGNDALKSTSEWDYSPLVTLRNANTFVGLKNGGATCYMNSVLQQLFTIEPLRNAIFDAVSPPLTDFVDDSSDLDEFTALPNIYSNPVFMNACKMLNSTTTNSLAVGGGGATETANQVSPTKIGLGATIDGDSASKQTISSETAASECGDETAVDSERSSSVSSSAPASAPKKEDLARKEYNVGVLRCVQLIFAHLFGSQLQYYVPKKFWKHFKFVGGESINLREQHDALEFFNKLVDSLDEALKVLGQPEICTKIFGGTFADQKICKGCPHRYTREEPFNTLCLDVRHHNNLLDSLQEYVKGDLLESENAYHCEKCNRKVDAVKRLCIKKLPPVLTIQLKRFDFDWEREVAVKFHDFFEFPREINMEPYTAQGLAKLEGEILEDDLNPNFNNGKPPEHSDSGTESSTNYKLRGIVVHSGQANGGHYYSYILHTFPSGNSKWFKFDDGDVSECHIEEDEEMRNQCFGGEYTTETYDHYCRRMQKRVTKRWWNAYILFYQRVEKIDSSSNDDASSTENLHKSFDTMTLSTRLRQMPGNLEQIVRRRNMKCVHERNQYTPEFFAFVRNLCTINIHNLKNSGGVTCANASTSGPAGPESGGNVVLDHNAESLLLLSVKLMSKFLFTTGFHAKRSLHGNNSLNDWSELANVAFKCSTQCRVWFAQEVLYKYPSRFAEYIFESPNAEVRYTFGRMITYLAKYSHDDPAALITVVPEKYLSSPTESLSDLLIRTLLTLVHKDNCDLRIRHLKEYVLNLYNYVSIGPAQKQQLIKLDVLSSLHKIGTELSDYPTVRGYSGDVNKLQNVISLFIRSLDVPPPAAPGPDISGNDNNSNNDIVDNDNVGNNNSSDRQHGNANDDDDGDNRKNNDDNVVENNTTMADKHDDIVVSDKDNVDDGDKDIVGNTLAPSVSSGLIEPNLETAPDSEPVPSCSSTDPRKPELLAKRQDGPRGDDYDGYDYDL